MADKIKFELPKFLLYSDNTYVSPSTLPVGPVSKGPNLARGREEYNKGNYTDSDAQAYAKKISGKAETISPEFDFISAIGLGGLKHFLFKSPKKLVDKATQVTTKYNEKLYPTTTFHYKVKHKLNNNKTLVETFPKYAKPNAPVEQSKQYLKKRLENGGYKKITGISYDYNTKSKVNKLFDPIEDSDYNGSYGSRFLIEDKTNRTTVKNSKNATHYFNKQNKESIIAHEVGHGLLYNHIPDNPILSGFGNLKRFLGKNYNEDNYFVRRNFTEMVQRGTQIKNYFGLTSPDQEITGPMLEYAYKNYIKDTGLDNDMSDFFAFIDDFDKAAKWINRNCLKEGGKI